VGKTSRKQQIR